MKRPNDEFKRLLAEEEAHRGVPPQQAEPGGLPENGSPADAGPVSPAAETAQPAPQADPAGRPEPSAEPNAADARPGPDGGAPAFESGLFGDIPEHRRRHRHKKRRMPAAAKTILTLLCLILVLSIALSGAFFTLRTMGQKDLSADPSDITIGTTVDYGGHTYVYNENVVTFAFLGVDKDTFGLEDDRVGTAGQSDTDMLLVLDLSGGRATLLSIPRETMVDVDVYSTDGAFTGTQQMQLCLAYAYGDGRETSCENALTSIRRLLYQIPVQKYFALELEGIGPINDAIGGVTLESLYDFPEQGIAKGDTVTITGSFAETYVRSRSQSSLDSSLDRLARQKQYLQAFAQQLLPAVRNDFSVIGDLYNTAVQYSTTNITAGDVTYLAASVLLSGIDSFETMDVPGEMRSVPTDTPDVVNAAFYPDETGLYELVLDLFYTQVS